MRELHLNERPISMLACQAANANRDPKQRKTPYQLEDFYLYQPPELLNAPEERYGASAFWLVEQGMYPGFALFCFPELNAHKGEILPTLIAYLHESAILLAPTHMDESSVTGLLIAEHLASNKQLDMESPCGRKIRVQMPAITDEVIAKEDAVLRLC